MYINLRAVATLSRRSVQVYTMWPRNKLPKPLSPERSQVALFHPEDLPFAGSPVVPAVRDQGCEAPTNTPPWVSGWIPRGSPVTPLGRRAVGPGLPTQVDKAVAWGAPDRQSTQGSRCHRGNRPSFTAPLLKIRLLDGRQRVEGGQGILGRVGRPWYGRQPTCV